MDPKGPVDAGLSRFVRTTREHSLCWEMLSEASPIAPSSSFGEMSERDNQLGRLELWAGL